MGDAISDMLAVLATLSILHMAPTDWDKEYTDLPNKLVKCIVPDRSIFQTTDQERKLQNPARVANQDRLRDMVSTARGEVLSGPVVLKML